MIRFVFNPRKTTQAAAFLLKLHGGRMPYMVLIKLLYLADREALIKSGTPITGDTLFSMKNGPILSHVLNWINSGQDPKEFSPWFEFVSEPDADKQVSLKVPFSEGDELSQFHQNILEQVHKNFGNMDRWALVDLLHKILPEWRDPDESSLPIAPEDILRAEKKSEEYIERLAKEAHEDQLLFGLARP